MYDAADRPVAGERTRFDGPPDRALRVAFYSHDAQGLGHTRRNLAIARGLTRLSPRPDILLLTGAPEAAINQRPENTDVVGLPAIGKEVDGEYAPRHLGIPLPDLVQLRARICLASLRAFAPDLLIVDKHPRGLFGELEPALRALSPSGTRIVLGLRDVLDEPAVARAQWAEERGTEALRRWYDGIWVYSDQALADPLDELNLPLDLRSRVEYVGYLATGRSTKATAGTAGSKATVAARTTGRAAYVLGMAGGGSDGAALAEAFVGTRWPAGVRGVFVTGPHLPAADRARLERLAGGRADLELLGHVDDPSPLLRDAAAIVSMGGYNTVCEVLAETAPLLVVPRTTPRMEQRIRAEKLATAGLLDFLPPEALTPDALRGWVEHALARPPVRRTGVDLDGLARIAESVAAHNTSFRRVARARSREEAARVAV